MALLPNKKINYVSLCSGYGAECMAFKRLKRDYPDFEFECVAWSEIEPNAIKAHDAVHPEYAGRNLGDMTTADYSEAAKTEGGVDLLFYSTPCQSVSTAGKRKGMKKGDDAASALIWHTERAIKELKPRVCILENVRGIVSKVNLKDFNEWCQTLDDLGYNNQWQILNASDYGVAQNRERVFMVSVLRDDNGFAPPYAFPYTMELDNCVNDYMDNEDDVAESYYVDPVRVTRKALSAMLQQPYVARELEALYHEENGKKESAV